MAKKKHIITDYATEDGRVSDKDFLNPEKALKNRAGGNVADIVGNFCMGMSLHGLDGYTGSAGIKHMLQNTEVTEQQFFILCGKHARTGAAIIAATGDMGSTSKVLSMATQFEGLAEQCNEDGEGGLDRLIEAEQAAREAAIQARKDDMLLHRVREAVRASDFDTLKQLSEGNSNAVKAAVTFYQVGWTKARTTAFNKKAGL